MPEEETVPWLLARLERYEGWIEDLKAGTKPVEYWASLDAAIEYHERERDIVLHKLEALGHG